jgi:hypothetical protein
MDMHDKAKDSAHKEGGLDDLISSIRTGKAFGSGDQQTQRQRRPRDQSISKKHGEDKQSFSNMQPANDHSALNRLRRQESTDAGKKEPPKFKTANDNSSELAKMLAKDSLKTTVPKGIKKEPVIDPRANLKSVAGSGIKETPSEIRNRFESKAT